MWMPVAYIKRNSNSLTPKSKLKHCYYVSRPLNSVFFIMFNAKKNTCSNTSIDIVTATANDDDTNIMHSSVQTFFRPDLISNFLFCHALRFSCFSFFFRHIFIHLYKLAITLSFNVTSRYGFDSSVFPFFHSIFENWRRKWPKTKLQKVATERLLKLKHWSIRYDIGVEFA